MKKKSQEIGVTTEVDATDRLFSVRYGSLAGSPSLVYLKSLERGVASWLDSIRSRIAAIESSDEPQPELSQVETQAMLIDQ